MATPQSQIGDPFADIADLLSSGDDRTAVRTYARAQAAQRGLDPDFVDRLLNRESGYSRRALSNQGARGVGQMMPGTGKRYGLKDPFDAKQNVDASLSYIQDLQKRFKGDQRLMAAGYHAGENDAEAALRNPKGNPKTNAYANAVAGDPFADIADLFEDGQPAHPAQPKPTRPAGPFTQARARELGQTNRPSEFNYQETKQREAERLRREQPSVSVLTGKPVTPRLQAQQSGIMRGKVKPGETPNQAFERALTPGPVSDIPKAIVQALTGVATDVGHLPATLLADLGALGGETPATRAMRGAMPATERAVAEALPLENPESLLTSVVPGAIAGTAPYLMASQLLTVAGLGAATGAGGSLKESQAAGADKPTQYLAAVINAIGGATEAVGAGGARARVKTGGGLLKAAGREGGQEFFQSGGQRVIQNLSALGYDPNREIDRGALDDAMLGLFVGSVVGGGVQGGADVAAARVKARQAADLINAQLKGEGDAKEIRVDAGQVQERGTVREAGEAKGSEDIQQPEKAGASPSGQEAQVKRTLQHEQFGEVQVERKASDGKLVVTDTEGETHTIKNPRTQGNQKATFVKRVSEEERQAAVERLRKEQVEQVPVSEPSVNVPSRPAEPVSVEPAAKAEAVASTEARQAEIARIRKENAGVLATPLMSEGAISPTQVNRMSERQKVTWQRDAQQRMELESQIRELGKSDEALARESAKKEQATRDAAQRADQSRFDLLSQFEPNNFRGISGSKKAYRAEYEALKAKLTHPPEPTKVEKVKQAAKERIAEREGAKATPESTYDASLVEFRAASQEFRKAQEAYRTKTIGDEEFLKAKEVFSAAQGTADKAETAFIEAKNGPSKPTRPKRVTKPKPAAVTTPPEPAKTVINGPITYEREAGRPFDKKNRYTSANYYDVTLGTEPNAPAVRIVRNSERVSDFTAQSMFYDAHGNRVQGSKIITEVNEASARAAAENYLRKESGAEPSIREASSEEAARIENAAQKQKPNETGLTKVQRDYLAGELREVHSSGEAPATIRVPGDGEFTVGGTRAAETLYKRVTGKPLEQAEGYGARNRLVTSDKATEALDRIKTRRKTERGSGGPSTEELADWLTIATYHIEAGAREFSDFVKRMVEDGGEQARTYAPILYAKARNYVDTGKLQDITGIKNAITTAERALRGQQEIEVEARRRTGQTWDDAKEMVDSGDVNPRALAQQIAERRGPVTQGITAEEQGVLLYDRMRISNEHRANSAAIEEALEKGDSTRVEQLMIERDVIEHARENNDIANKRVGYEWGYAGRFRQLLVKEDYSLLSMVQRVKAASGKSEIEPKLRAQIEKLTTELEATTKKLEASEKQITQMESERTAKTLIDETVRQEKIAQRREKRSATKKELDDELSALVADWKTARKELHVGSGLAALDPEGKLTRILGKMAVNRIKSGTVTVEALVDELKNTLGDAIEGWSNRDIMEAVSGYGKERNQTRDELQLEINRLKREMRQSLKQEDIEAGKVLDPRIKASRTRGENRIKELEGRVQRGEYARTKREPIKDPEVERLRIRASLLQRQLDQLERSQMPGHWWRNASALRKAWMLMSPKTWGYRNPAGNTAFQVYDEIARVPAAIFDVAASMATGQRAISGPIPVATLDSILSGGKKGLTEAGHILKHGATREELAELQFPSEVNTGSKIIDVSTQAVFRVMTATDRVFYNIAYKRALNDRARIQALNEVKKGELDREATGSRTRTLMTTPNTELMDSARHDALVATFNNNNALSDGIKRMRSRFSPAQNFALDLVIPFDRTPTNIVMRVLEASPVGLVKTAAKAAKGIVNQAMTVEEQRQMSQSFGRSVTGSGVMLLGWKLASMGLLTGAFRIGGKRDEEKEPASLKVGDKWVNIGQLSPVGNLLVLGAGLWEDSQRKGFDRFGAGLTAIGGAVVEQPILRSTSVLAEAAQGRGTMRALARLAFSAVPASGLIRETAVLTDKEKRKVSSETSAEGFKEQFQQNIPGLRQQLPKREPDARKQAINSLRKDPKDTRMLDELIGKGEMTQAQKADIIRDARLTPFQLEFQNKDLAEKLKSFRDFTPEQKAQTRLLLSESLKQKKKMPPAKLHRLQSEYPREMALQ